jgi:hypothetical protein
MRPAPYRSRLAGDGLQGSLGISLPDKASLHGIIRSNPGCYR